MTRIMIGVSDAGCDGIAAETRERIMSVRVTRTNVCDRCGEDFVFSWPDQTIAHLSYMVLINGSGSQDSNMDLDLCNPCTVLFRSFMKGKQHGNQGSYAEAPQASQECEERGASQREGVEEVRQEQGGASQESVTY